MWKKAICNSKKVNGFYSMSSKALQKQIKANDRHKGYKKIFFHSVFLITGSLRLCLPSLKITWIAITVSKYENLTT
jgi:membrane protein CcdC involved in cytochrome C biogenesis